MNETERLHDQLLATKFFIPSFPHALILRPRLLELLTKKSLECKLTLASAKPRCSPTGSTRGSRTAHGSPGCL